MEEARLIGQGHIHPWIGRIANNIEVHVFVWGLFWWWRTFVRGFLFFRFLFFVGRLFGFSFSL